jgi:hypothetical protein
MYSFRFLKVYISKYSEINLNVEKWNCESFIGTSPVDPNYYSWNYRPQNYWSL